MADENVLSNDDLELRWTALRQTLGEEALRYADK